MSKAIDRSEHQVLLLSTMREKEEDEVVDH